MKKIRNKLGLLVLVLLLSLTINGVTNVSASSTQLPSGKNYLDPAYIENFGNAWEYGEPIFVKANTDYTLTFPSSYAYDVFEGDHSYIEVMLQGNSSNIFDEPVDEAYPHDDVFDVVGSHMISITFNTGSNTQIIALIFESPIDFITYAVSQGAYFQLEEGTSSTVFETYIAPANDIIAPIINGGVGVIPTNVNDPITVATILSGLTSSDETDGVLTVVVQSDLYTGNENVLGEYDVVFRATDLSGNYTEVTTTIAVVDTDEPIITLIGVTPLYVEFGTSYSEPGANVSDNYDSGLSVVITGTVNNSALGTYTINYNVTDSSTNAASQVSRSVIVRDTIAPEQVLTGDSTIYVEFGDNYTELGSTWTDSYDGSGSSNVSGSVNVGSLGTYTIYYNFTDSSGNVASQLSRTVIVRDTTSPVFVGDTSYSWNISLYNNLNDLLSLITANDLFDGDLTSSITVESDTYSGNTTVLGTYTVVLRVTDSSGNYTDMSITINIIDDIPPTFSTTLTILTWDYYNSMTQQDLVDYFNN